MKEFNESEIKYLAGLLDADGSLSLTHNNGYLGLVLNLELSESCDRNGQYILSLCNRVGTHYEREREGWSRQHTWRVCKRSDLEVLIPRLVKHMVIKAKHWNYLLELFRENKAMKISDIEYQNLHSLSLNSRLITGPLHEKVHPTWAWATGYIEGDGWFLIREREHQIEMSVGVVSDENDRVGIDLLYKAFGGIVKKDKEGHIRWVRNLGPRDYSFVTRFLPKLIKHSKLKTHKMERILSIHSQRLNVSTPTGEVIV